VRAEGKAKVFFFLKEKKQKGLPDFGSEPATTGEARPLTCGVSKRG
jgi:hypothetical protein